MSEVSVVVPTHDREALLRQTLGSILGQRGVDFEVIVVDDGSSDDTATVVDGLGHDHVRLVRHPTARGLSAARNRGVAEAAGAWLAFCDDDDLWAPDKLARQLQAARQTGASWVYTGEVHVDADGWWSVDAAHTSRGTRRALDEGKCRAWRLLGGPASP